MKLSCALFNHFNVEPSNKGYFVPSEHSSNTLKIKININCFFLCTLGMENVEWTQVMDFLWPISYKELKSLFRSKQFWTHFRFWVKWHKYKLLVIRNKGILKKIYYFGLYVFYLGSQQLFKNMSIWYSYILYKYTIYCLVINSVITE